MRREFKRFLQEQPRWNKTTRAIYLGWSQTYQDFLASRSLTWQVARRRDLEDFQQQLLWTPNGHGGLKSGNTIYQGLRLLRAFYRWAVSRQLACVSPMDGWVLARPPSRPRRSLTWEETQQLFRGPDLGQPSGHRDLLLLHLIYQGLPLRECRQLDIESEVPVEDTLAAIRWRYLTRARPRLLGDQQHTRLLVSDRGRPYGSNTGPWLRLQRYLPGLNVWILWDSRRAHEEELGRRLAKLPPCELH